MLPGDAIGNLEETFMELEKHGSDEFASEALEGAPHRSVDLRYRGQGYELNVAFDPQSPSSAIEAFHQLHRQRYGFCDPQRPLEIVNLRLRMTASAPPYAPSQSELVPNDGSEACYAERAIFFHGQPRPSKLYRREALPPGALIEGSAMITEYTSATILPPGCWARVDGFRNLVITVSEEANV
jgi:N-methylhydantoinase A